MTTAIIIITIITTTADRSVIHSPTNRESFDRRGAPTELLCITFKTEEVLKVDIVSVADVRLYPLIVQSMALTVSFLGERFCLWFFAVVPIGSYISAYDQKTGQR